ncbi:MAG: hypothetical protein K9M57_09480, partial [Phycisphaerae bacterium]|nr:hypothetical protein [Phycisphaerae bacterium]
LYSLDGYYGILKAACQYFPQANLQNGPIPHSRGCIGWQSIDFKAHRLHAIAIFGKVLALG